MAAPFKFPFFDVSRQFPPLKKQVLSKFEELLDKQAFILGETVSAFEKDLAGWIGAKHAVTISNGTEALTVALRALGVGPGDEVITSAFSFFASTGCILLVGAKPVFVDIDPKTYNIDPRGIEKAITPKTKCILPVHLYGQCADMDAILAVAAKSRIPVLEDFAQSIGAEYKGRQAGTLGALGATSFYPTKNLGGAGEGGAVVTNSDEIAEKVRLIRVHGMPKRYHHDFLGTNARLNSLQCAYLHAKLPHLRTWMDSRRRLAARYMTELRPLTDRGLVLPVTVEGCTHVWNQFIVRVPHREQVQAKLAERGVPSEIYYPMTIPEQKALRGIAPEKGWPEAERAAREVLALPIFPELREDEQSLVIEALKAAF
jgi:dTDP-4-amino-4,6-dideoxygalactose transaminase